MSITDADTWLRRTGLPYWSLAVFREMKVNDAFILINFVGPGIFSSDDGSVCMDLYRKRGFWVFETLWMLGDARGSGFQRTHIFCPDVRFKILPGRKIQWLDSDNGARLVRLILHRALVMANMARKDGDLKAVAAIHPLNFRARSRSVSRSERDALAWLQSRRDTLKWLAK